jgi:hypothetical protein
VTAAGELDAVLADAERMTAELGDDKPVARSSDSAASGAVRLNAVHDAVADVIADGKSRDAHAAPRLSRP